jgi:hypothetical protein
MRAMHARWISTVNAKRPNALHRRSGPRRCAVAVVFVLSLLTGCGNPITTDINGAVAAKLDGSGSVLLLLRVCSGAVNRLELYEPRTGPDTQASIPIGIWHSSAPLKQNAVLNLNDPGPVWELQRDPGPLNPDTPYSVSAENTTADEQLSSLTFKLRNLESLRAEQVLFNGRVLQEAEFSRLESCKTS